MSLGFVARSCWPAVGGIEQHIRTLSGALATTHQIRLFAHRIDTDGTQWKGPLDRSDPFRSFVDPLTGVTTVQLRLTRSDLALIVPVGAAAKALERSPDRKDRAREVFEHWHAGVAGRRFSRQFGDTQIIHRFGGNRMALATVRAARRLRIPVAITPFAHPGHWDDDCVSAEAYRCADLIVATTRSDAATYEGLGVDPSRIRICPLPTPAPARSTVELRHEATRSARPLVLFLGARRPYKGVNDP